MKGIVMKLEHGKATVLQNGGGFVSVPARPDWQVGDVVTVHKAPAVGRRLLALAASFVLVISLSLTGYQAYAAPVTLVSVDVSPSLELSLNRFDRVVSTDTRNAQGEEVLSGTSLKNMLYTDAVALLLQEEYLGSYIGEAAYLVITVQSSNAQKEQALLDSLRDTTEEAVSHHHNLSAEYYCVDDATVTAAHAHGMTAGKYLTLLELLEVAPEVDIGTYRHHTVDEIKEQISRHSEGHHGDSPAAPANSSTDNGHKSGHH